MCGMSEGPYFVYLMANHLNTVMYCGQTHDLLKRVWEHKQGLVDGFTKKYRVTKLVFYEVADNREGALYREKQIKGYSRKKKMLLIESTNPTWRDLYNDLISEEK